MLAIRRSTRTSNSRKKLDTVNSRDDEAPPSEASGMTEGGTALVQGGNNLLCGTPYYNMIIKRLISPRRFVVFF